MIILVLVGVAIVALAGPVFLFVVGMSKCFG